MVDLEQNERERDQEDACWVRQMGLRSKAAKPLGSVSQEKDILTPTPQWAASLPSQAEPDKDGCLNG